MFWNFVSFTDKGRDSNSDCQGLSRICTFFFKVIFKHFETFHIRSKFSLFIEISASQISSSLAFLYSNDLSKLLNSLAGLLYLIPMLYVGLGRLRARVGLKRELKFSAAGYPHHVVQASIQGGVDGNTERMNWETS